MRAYAFQVFQDLSGGIDPPLEELRLSLLLVEVKASNISSKAVFIVWLTLFKAMMSWLQGHFQLFLGGFDYFRYLCAVRMRQRLL